MIIYEDGAVVGYLDDRSLKESEVTSVKLAETLAELKQGLPVSGPVDAELSEGQVDATQTDILPYAPENVDVIRLALFKAGFEVQSA